MVRSDAFRCSHADATPRFRRQRYPINLRWRSMPDGKPTRSFFATQICILCSCVVFLSRAISRHALRIMSIHFPHVYPGVTGDEFHFTSDCIYDCGSWMGSARSGGPRKELYEKHDLSVPLYEMGAHGNCPAHPDYVPIYDRYPMDHRPVSVLQQEERDRQNRKMEALLGDGI